MKYTYKNDLSELNKLAEDIKSFCKSEEISQKITYEFNLCLDEILTNIISYGLKEIPKGQEKITLDLILQNNQVTAIMEDNAIPYNPLNEKNRNPDITSGVDKREIGGLGIYFLEQYMDKVEYQHFDGKNRLTLTKKITS